MLNIKIITVGKLKEKYWKEAEFEYIKRLTPYCKLKIVEITEEAFSDSSNKEKIKLSEAEKILKLVEKSQIIIALNEHGKEYNSPELAGFMQKISSFGDEITFIIGGPLGLHEEILKKAKHKISLSKLTFTHQMVKIFLLEQIYRCVMILGNRKYHY